jgi:anti-sigma B factor antagonist
MELSVQACGHEGEVLVIAPAAKPVTLEATNADDFRIAAEAAIGEARQVVLDMRLVEFVDSSGLSSLVALARALHQRDGELRLAGLQRRVWTVFEVTRLYRTFEIHDTPADAVESFYADDDWD